MAVVRLAAAGAVTLLHMATVVVTSPPNPLDEPVELRVRETVEEVAASVNQVVRQKGQFVVLTAEDGKSFTIAASLVASIHDE
jgi:hypothetical protein